ncbi:MAG TPA: 2-succinyl-5-enolpyruvyl-6-hydroxy-3-cyclohexene-1-carboxylic-acid synthase [Flavobacterium sp.]
MIFPKIPLAQSIIAICSAKGVRHIVISPGSRNAPLTIGFVNNPNFTCYSIADERCAAFFALGIAQQRKEPVAVVCTSGSAVLNFYPALAEAFYSQIPLIVISADRPENKIDIGDGQTIRQRNVFENHSLYNANLSEAASAENDRKINEAIDIATSGKGPVHINAPFEEPLYQTVAELMVTPKVMKARKIAAAAFSPEEYNETWQWATRKLVLVGGLDPNTISDEIINALATDPSVVVMTEVTSNLHHPGFLSNIDTIITPFNEEAFTALRPDLLITLGGMVVSKRIKSFLRQHRPKNHWHVDLLRAYNTFGCLTKHIVATPGDFLKQMTQLPSIESDYALKAADVKKLRAEKHQKYVQDAPFSDFKAFEQIAATIPQNAMLQISNSAAIRYAQLFKIDSSVVVFCNRGTSGIDGSTSTAIGAAVASEKQTVLITGDIGFLYDSNALWNNYIPKNFKIILINNGGGGIFRILPGHQENEVFNTFFETSHCLTAEHLAKMYRFQYYTASNETNLKEALEKVYGNDDAPSILEVFTPTEVNDKVLLGYFEELT